MEIKCKRYRKMFEMAGFKTSICLLLFFFMFSDTLLAQSIFEDKQKVVIVKNKIAAQTTWDYYYIKGKPSKSGIKTSYIKYNQLGNVIESITYKMQDTLALESYKYNREGKRTDYTKKRGVKIAYQKSSQFNEKGYLISEDGFDGTCNFQNQYEYIADGKLRQITYTLDKKINECRTFEHTGDITMISIIDPAGVTHSYLSLKYDAKENVIEEIIYDSKKLPLEKKILVYNNDNKVISEVKYRGDNFYYKLTYLYNSKGDLTNIDEENPEEGRYLKKQFVYDQKDNLATMKWRRNAKEDFSERNYQYDDKNLCTQYETFYPGTKFRVLTKLTYEDF